MTERRGTSKVRGKMAGIGVGKRKGRRRIRKKRQGKV